MLLAILYTSDDFVAATALACDQQPFGDRYWSEIHNPPVAARSESETAYIEVDDEQLAGRLLGMEFIDGFEASTAIDAYLQLAGPKNEDQISAA